jgi:hypothetical protein
MIQITALSSLELVKTNNILKSHINLSLSLPVDFFNP